MSKKGTRRKYLEDSFSSHSSGQTRSTVYSKEKGNQNSFLSDDRSRSSLSNKSDASALTNDSDAEDSFVVNDDECTSDDSFHSASESSLTSFRSPMPPPRKQQNRFAKRSLDKPLNEPFSFTTPVTNRQTQTEPRKKKTEQTPRRKALEDPEQRALFLELYPEYKDELVSDEEEEEKSIQLVTLSSDSEEETEEPVSATSTRSESDRSRNSSESSSESAFERYLNFLKGEKKKDVNENEDSSGEVDRPPSEDFVVSDSESVYSVRSDDLEAEESSSEDEETDDEKENVPAVPKPKSKLVNSLISSFDSPSVKSKKNVDDYFLASLSTNYPGQRHSDAVRFVKNGIKQRKLREELTDRIFDILIRSCFDGENFMQREQVVWSSRLRTTAGQCKNMRRKSGTRYSNVELSVKVCTTPERLRDTLVHEMCHAATFLIDGQVKAGHGPWWQKWTRRCLQRCPSLPPIGVCHGYEIVKKYIYECLQCTYKIGRHSKSFDIKKYCCGKCGGKFVLTKDGKPVTEDSQKKTTAFANFVQLNYNKHTQPGRKHNEVMKILSAQWRESKEENKKKVEELEVDISVLSIHE